MKAPKPVLWEKTYYGETFLDNSFYNKRTKQVETGDWSGFIFLYKIKIVKYKNTNRLIIEPDGLTFRGTNREDMARELEKAVEGKEEWNLKGKHWRDTDFFPEEVNQKLVEFNLEKYVKKIS